MEGIDGLSDATFALEKIPVPFVTSQQPDIQSCVFGIQFFKKVEQAREVKSGLVPSLNGPLTG